MSNELFTWDEGRARFGISKELKTLVLMSIVHRSPRIHCCAPYISLLCLRELLEAIARRSLISWFALNA